MKKQLVFVYGTLRKHESNHFLLKEAKCMARQCWTEGKLFDSSFGYPFLVQSPKNRVYGELYQVNDSQLKALDRLEGYDGPGQNNYYDRQEQIVHTDSGNHQALVYIFPNGKHKENLKLINSGDWKVERLLKNKQTIHYFAYGSCMDTERFQKAGVDHFFQKVKGLGVLEGYDLQFTRRSHDGGRADVVEQSGRVEGKVYEISCEALKYLYRREGVNASCYRPAIVDVMLNSKILKNVLTFLVVDKETETAPPEHYLHEILRGGAGFLSEQYLENLKARLKDKFNLSV